MYSLEKMHTSQHFQYIWNPKKSDQTLKHPPDLYPPTPSCSHYITLIIVWQVYMLERLKKASYALCPTMVLFVLPLLLARGGLCTSLWKVGLPYTDEATPCQTKTLTAVTWTMNLPSAPHHLQKIPSRKPGPNNGVEMSLHQALARNNSPATSAPI